MRECFMMALYRSSKYFFEVPPPYLYKKFPHLLLVGRVVLVSGRFNREMFFETKYLI